MDIERTNPLGSADGEDFELLPPRDWHYDFAHQALRSVAFEQTDKLLAALSDPEQINKVPASVMRCVAQNLGLSEDAVASHSETIRVHAERAGILPVYIFELPPPITMNEAHFVAIVNFYTGTPQIRYYTLERTFVGGTAFCSWNTLREHQMYGDSPLPDIKSFLATVTAHLSAEADFVSANRAMSSDTDPEDLSPEALDREWLLANEAYQSGNFAAALPRLKIVAYRNNTEAQRLLATMYAGGKGVERDYDTAAFWLREACNAGSREALRSIAELHESGRMYQDGRGIPPDPIEAYRMFLELANANDTAEAARLDALISPSLAEAATALELAREKYRHARTLYDQLSRAGNVKAILALARMYEEGLGCPLDPVKAYEFYLQAAQLGDPAAKIKTHRLRPKLTRSMLSTPQFHMPDHQRRVEGGREYSFGQWEMIQRGYCAGGMSKWLLMVEEDRLFAVRAWSGALFADVHFQWTGSGTKISHLLIPEQSEMSDAKARELIYELIDRFLLGIDDSEQGAP